MKIIDVTRPLMNGMLVYPGDRIPSFSQVDHGRYLISDLHMSSHTGTHIDAPAHYLKSGETIDTIPLRHIIGRCRVIDMRVLGDLDNCRASRGKTRGGETAPPENQVFRKGYSLPRSILPWHMMLHAL